MAHALIIMKKKQKLDAHFIECIFLGYGEKSKACRLMITSRRQIVVLRNVVFYEFNLNTINNVIQ
jgi:hypothetical protein